MDTTYQDVLDAPPNMAAHLIDGEAYLQSRPAGPHIWASGRLFSAIDGKYGDYVDRLGNWVIPDETDLHPGEDVLVSDIACWGVENLPQFPATSKFHIAPDWICEVLSPSTRQRDLGPQRDIYAREGVKHFWIVDPNALTLQAHAPSGGNWLSIATLQA